MWVIHASQELFERSLVVYIIKAKILQKSRWEIYLVFDAEFVACLHARTKQDFFSSNSK